MRKILLVSTAVALSLAVTACDQPEIDKTSEEIVADETVVAEPDVEDSETDQSAENQEPPESGSADEDAAEQ